MRSGIITLALGRPHRCVISALMIRGFLRSSGKGSAVKVLHTRRRAGGRAQVDARYRRGRLLRGIVLVQDVSWLCFDASTATPALFIKAPRYLVNCTSVSLSGSLRWNWLTDIVVESRYELVDHEPELDWQLHERELVLMGLSGHHRLVSRSSLHDVHDQKRRKECRSKMGRDAESTVSLEEQKIYWSLLTSHC
jgi:hypothetical protein